MAGAKQRLLWYGLMLLLTWAKVGRLSAQELFPPKPEPAVFVHDYSGWLSPSERAFLEERLRRYADTTSTEIVVMIRPDIGDYDRASYAFELGNRWGVGRKSKNNGVVVLIVTEPPQRGVFIATGYGVEGALPDITAGQIVRYLMIPRFKEGRYFEGINAGLDGITAALAGEFRAADPQSISVPGWVVLLFILLVLLLFLFLSFLVRKGILYAGSGPIYRAPTRTDRGGAWRGGFFGGGSFGGGSFGGGRSFGGGSFGGGGAGGSW